eukprot:COSAG05_NODE_2930_length_2493_cov_16.300926_1_plen_208_part_00
MDNFGDSGFASVGLSMDQQSDYYSGPGGYSAPGMNDPFDDSKYNKRARQGDSMMLKYGGGAAAVLATLGLVLWCFSGTSTQEAVSNNVSGNESSDEQLQAAWALLEKKCSPFQDEVACCLGDSTCTWTEEGLNGVFKAQCVTTNRAERENLVGQCPKGLGAIPARPSGAPPQDPRATPAVKAWKKNAALKGKRKGSASSKKQPAEKK